MGHNHHILFDLFPPPEFLRMPSIGLDVSDEVVRFAQLIRKRNLFELGIYGEKKIPRDVIEEGYIKDKASLTKTLDGLRRQYGLRYVRASLPEEKSYLFRTTVPAMASADIRNAVRFKIEENVPVTLDSAIFDYRIINQPTPENNRIDLSVTVIHTKVVSNYLEVFRAAGLEPLEFRIESHAIAHALVAPNDYNTYIVIMVRETKTVLAIVSRGIVQFSSTLTTGGDAITASIKKNLSVDDNEAAKIRRGKESRDSNEMFLSLMSAATMLRDEIQKLFAYWDGHSTGDHQSIDSVIISGSDSLLGLDDYLSRSLKVPVQIADVWKNIAPIGDYVPSLVRREALDYVPALGLALPYD